MTAKKHPLLSRAIQRTLWTTYDNLTIFIVLSLIWIIASFTIFLIPATTAALFVYTKKKSLNEKVKLKDLISFARKYFFQSTILSFLHMLITVLLIFNTFFYLMRMGTIGFLLGAVSFWILIFIIAIGIHIFPLIILDKKISYIIKNSILLTLSHLSYTLRGVLFLLPILGLTIVFPILGISMGILFINNFFFELQAVYNQDLTVPESNRSIKELIKPWEFH